MTTKKKPAVEKEEEEEEEEEEQEDEEEEEEEEEGDEEDEEEEASEEEVEKKEHMVKDDEAVCVTPVGKRVRVASPRSSTPASATAMDDATSLDTTCISFLSVCAQYHSVFPLRVLSIFEHPQAHIRIHGRYQSINIRAPIKLVCL